MSIFIGNTLPKKLYIGEGGGLDYSAKRGPCPNGFHIPEWSEISSLYSKMTALGLTSTGKVLKESLLMPNSGKLSATGNSKENPSTYTYIVSCQARNNNTYYQLSIHDNSIYNTSYGNKSSGTPIRPFSDEIVVPDENWTVIFDGSEIETGAGVFHNEDLKLISVSSDGEDWITIRDRNLGASQVWSPGDTVSESNHGGYFQWGNNYMFPFSIADTKYFSSTKVDTSGYGPGNYYCSWIYILAPSASSTSRDYPANNNLWGGETAVGRLPNIKKVFKGVVKVYPKIPSTEYIEYRMKVDGNGNLYIPIAGRYHNTSIFGYYDWWISIDGGEKQRYNGYGEKGGSITLDGYVTDTIHTIRIEPDSGEYGWATCYGWKDTVGAEYLTEVIYDGSYIGYAENERNTGSYFRYLQYCGCTGLTSCITEVLPSSVTEIGMGFRQGQYYGCTGITTPAVEVMSSNVVRIKSLFRQGQYGECTGLTSCAVEVVPNGVSVIEDFFRESQYNGCTGITTPAVEVLPSGLTSLGGGYRSTQYYGCSGLTSCAVEVVSSNITNVGDYFRNGQYYNCTSITTPAVEVLPSGLTTIGGYFRYGQYYGCIGLISCATEVLPSGVTTIGRNFRGVQYYGCTEITTAPIEVLPNTVTSIGDYFRYGQYYTCSKLASFGGEVISSNVTKINNYFRYAQFYKTKLVTVPTEVLPNITSVGHYFRAYQYYNCTSLVNCTEEVLPSGVTSIGDYFRQSQFYNCTALKHNSTSIREVMPDTVTTIGGYFRYTQFSGCTAMRMNFYEAISSNLTTVGNYYRRGQYSNCHNIVDILMKASSATFGTNKRTVNYSNAIGNNASIMIDGDVVEGGLGTNSCGLDNSKVNRIYVKTSLVDGYKNSAARSNITDSKFYGIG